MWRFLTLHYCVGHDSRACGDHWISGSLKGLCVCHLHVSVVLLCSAYRAFSCSLLFRGSPPLSPPLYYIFYTVFYIGSPLFFQFSVTGAWARVGVKFFSFLVGRARGWFASRVGSWVFWLLGFGFSSSNPPPPPHVPGHPSSICDEGLNKKKDLDCFQYRFTGQDSRLCVQNFIIIIDSIK